MQNQVSFLKSCFETIEYEGVNFEISLDISQIPRREQKALLELTKLNLFKKITAKPKCISCNLPTEEISKDRVVKTVCTHCGTESQFDKEDCKEYKTSFRKIIQFIEKQINLHDSENINAQIIYLGQIVHDSNNFEIYLLQGISSKDADKLFEEVLQQTTKQCIILTLSKNSTAKIRKNIKDIQLSNCINWNGKSITWNWPENTFDEKDANKQMAAQIRLKNDPKNIAKENLRKHIAENYIRLFQDKMHNKIALEIKTNYASWIEYRDKNNSKCALSNKIILNVIKEYLKKMDFQI